MGLSDELEDLDTLDDPDKLDDLDDTDELDALEERDELDALDAWDELGVLVEPGAWDGSNELDQFGELGESDDSWDINCIDTVQATCINGLSENLNKLYT